MLRPDCNLFATKYEFACRRSRHARVGETRTATCPRHAAVGRQYEENALASIVVGGIFHRGPERRTHIVLPIRPIHHACAWYGACICGRSSRRTDCRADQSRPIESAGGPGLHLEYSGVVASVA